MTDERMRIDKWLWVARFFKTRSLASMAIASHKIRCNGDHVNQLATSRSETNLRSPSVRRYSLSSSKAWRNNGGQLQRPDSFTERHQKAKPGDCETRS